MKLKKQLKKGIIVKILSGKDKGKTGKVIKLFKESSKVMVDGVNMYKKNKRPKKQGQKGEVISIPRPIHMSNLEIEGGKSKK